MRLDARARLGLAALRLDDVGIDRPLHEERLRAVRVGEEAHLLRLFLEAADELLADDRALALGVGDVCETREKTLRRVHVHEAQARSERRDDLLGLALAQETVVDEHAGEAI